MDVFVGRLMSTPVQTVGQETTIQQAATCMREHEVGSLVVVDDNGHLEGILTSTDFVRAAAAGDNPTTASVAGYMSTDVTTATANDDIQDVATTMIECGFHHVPVVDDVEGVIGIITTTDLTEYLSHVEVAPTA